MVSVVVSNKDVDGMVALATGAEIKPPEKKPEKAEAEAKSEAKPEQKVETTEADDVEGEDGLTPAQKRELSAKMLAAIGKKHRQMMEAKEALSGAEGFATEQYNTRMLAEKRAQELADEIERLKKAQIRVEPPKEKIEPKREAFKTEAEYNDALIDWKVEQKLESQRIEAEKQRVEAIAKKTAESVIRALEYVPDFRTKTENADFIVPGSVSVMMQESDLFAEIGYHFAEHPEELARLAILPIDKQKVEFKKIESRITPFVKSASADTTKDDGGEPSKTPSEASSKTEEIPSRSRAAVITPLNTGSAAQVEKPHSQMSSEEALQAWQKKHGRDLKARKRH